MIREAGSGLTCLGTQNIVIILKMLNQLFKTVKNDYFKTSSMHCK